jgi:hypothetical protein
MQNIEVWKNLPDYDGIYQVSNLGDVKSLGNNKTKKEKILKKHIGKDGYFRVKISKNTNNTVKLVHQLVAITFLGHKPDGTRIVVDHINNIKTDNRLENLQLITHRYNLSKDKKNKTSKYTGVCWGKHHKKWLCTIRINGKINYLGSFTNQYDAHITYQNKLKEITNNKN